MTAVCCWLDNSLGRSRVTAIADSRITSKKSNKERQTVEEYAQKLHRIRVNCFNLTNFDVNLASFQKPYFTTDIGIGFSGSCLEALAVISLISKALEQLVNTHGETPKPTPEGIANLAECIVQKYFRQHKRPTTQNIELLLFGYSAINGAPWIYKITHKAGGNVERTHLLFEEKDFHVIGSIKTETKYEKEVCKLREKIIKHKNGLKIQEVDDPKFKHELEQARHDIALTKIAQERLQRQIENEFAEGVGGTLQKLEVYLVEGQKAVISFSRDDRSDILKSLPSVGEGNKELGYCPITEGMS